MNEYDLKKCEDYIVNFNKFLTVPTVDMSRHALNVTQEVKEYIQEHIDLSNIFDCEKNELLHKLLLDKQKHYLFGHLIRNTQLYDLDVNEHYQDRTLLMNFVDAYLPQMKERQKKLNWGMFDTLVSIPYKVTPQDIEYSQKLFKEVKSNFNYENKWLLVRVFVELGKEDYFIVRNTDKKLAYIVSLKQGYNFGIGFKTLIESVIQALTYHKDIGSILLGAVDEYGRKDMLNKGDNDRVYRNLRAEFLQDVPEQNIKLEATIIKLFPELADYASYSVSKNNGN